MDIQKIKELALANGFKLKEQASGNMDLNAYVYDFANAIEQATKAQAVHEDFDLWWEGNAIAMMCEEDEALKIWQAKANVPEGFVLVPKEPTQAMLDSARDWSTKKYGKAVGNDGASGCYKAMIEAQENQG